MEKTEAQDAQPVAKGDIVSVQGSPDSSLGGLPAGALPLATVVQPHSTGWLGQGWDFSNMCALP